MTRPDDQRPVLRIRIRDLVPFLSWIRDPEQAFSGSLISDPGSQTHIFDIIMTNFLVKSTIILSALANKNSLPGQKEIIYNFMMLVATKNGRTKKFPPPSFGAVVGSGIWDR